jgi:uncharacterized DUF497 family protein
MEFLWDNANIDHIALHEVTPEEAEQVIENEPLEIGKVERNGELRIVHLGETDAGRVLLVAVTYRAGHVRAVTAYPASRKFRKFYDREKAKTNDTDPENT